MLELLLDRYGDGTVLALAGALVGLVFGAAAQHSRFCLRAATVEVAQGKFGPKLSIWLIAFTTALATVQMAILMGLLETDGTRQLAAVGSLSGALIGGVLFGAGMVLARGCASRLLVLSATGNLRAIVTGLVLTLVAQASLRGVLAPARENLASLWTVSGGEARHILELMGLPVSIAALAATSALIVSFQWSRHQGVAFSRICAAAGVGLAVALGWFFTYQIAQTSFEVIPVASVTFTGPSTDTLMGLVNAPALPLNFGVGLVPGVFVGAGLMAVASGEWRIQRFEADTPMERYLIGASLMGFGSMLAGGCAVGAGMSGGAVLSLTAWVAVAAMWLGAVATHRLLNLGMRGATT